MITSRVKRHQNRGFTAVEIMVVVVAIGVVMAILVPVITWQRETAAVTRTVADIRQYQKVVQSLEIGAYPLTDRITTTSNLAGTNFATTTLAAADAALRFDQVVMSLGKFPRLFDSGLVTIHDVSESVPASPTAVSDPRWNPETGMFYARPDVAVTHDWSGCARLESALSSAAAPVAAQGANFYLDGTQRLPTGARVVYAVLPGISQRAAFRISAELNGADAMDSTDGSVGQNRGQAVFDVPVDGRTTLYVYIAHR